MISEKPTWNRTTKVPIPQCLRKYSDCLSSAGVRRVITCWSKLHCTNMLLGKTALGEGGHLQRQSLRKIHTFLHNKHLHGGWVADTACFHSS